jgi:hypothetical protein
MWHKSNLKSSQQSSNENSSQLNSKKPTPTPETSGEKNTQHKSKYGEHAFKPEHDHVSCFHSWWKDDDLTITFWINFNVKWRKMIFIMDIEIAKCNVLAQN